MHKWRVPNLVTLVFMLIVTAMADGIPFNAQTTADVSAKFPTLFTPAGFTFSIWGLIYIALIGFAIYPFLPGALLNARLEKIGGWFAAANLLNAFWLAAWHWELFWLSVLLILGLLGCLLVLHQRLEIGRHGRVNPVEQGLVDVPVSLYLGWISVATIANISVALSAAGWNGFGIAPETWAILMIGVTTLLGILMIHRRNALTYPAVLIWALIGLRLKSSGAESVGLAAGIGAFILLIYLIFRLLRARQTAMLAARGTRPTD